MNANTAIAASEIGMPPHTRVRNTDEYGLIIAAWQPDAPASALEPGMNEQWIEWTCRSRCWTKSYVEMPAKMSPASAPTSTTTSHAGGLMRPMLARAASV